MAKASKDKPNAIPFSNNLDSDQGRKNSNNLDENP
jgi:hypothetical protein